MSAIGLIMEQNPTITCISNLICDFVLTAPQFIQVKEE